MSSLTVSFPQLAGGEHQAFDNLAGYQALTNAVIRQAAEDANRGDILSRVWLLSSGYDLLEFTGWAIPFDAWRRWVVAGCPGKQQVRRKFAGAVRVCKRCGNEYTPRGNGQKYCDHCRKAGK